MSFTPAANSELEKISDTGLELADATQDIRNDKVVDTAGNAVGHVSALFIDRAERKVRMIEVRAGGILGIGDRHFLLPVETIVKVEKREVQINQTSERIVQSPVYDPEIVEAASDVYWEPFYGYYGLSPYWGERYASPHFPIFAEAKQEEKTEYRGD